MLHNREYYFVYWFSYYHLLRHLGFEPTSVELHHLEGSFKEALPTALLQPRQHLKKLKTYLVEAVVKIIPLSR